MAGPTSTAGPATDMSSPPSGEAPACQQMSSGSWSPGSPMSARNLSATGNGSGHTLQPARSRRRAPNSAARSSDSVPPMRGPMVSERWTRSSSARPGRIALTTWPSRTVSAGARSAPGRGASVRPRGAAGGENDGEAAGGLRPASRGGGSLEATGVEACVMVMVPESCDPCHTNVIGPGVSGKRPGQSAGVLDGGAQLPPLGQRRWHAAAGPSRASRARRDCEVGSYDARVRKATSRAAPRAGGDRRR